MSAPAVSATSVYRSMPGSTLRRKVFRRRTMAQFPTSGAVNISGPVAGKQFYRAVYLGDTWKVSNKLTLNLGLRYDLQGPWSERFDRLTYFNPSVANLTVTGCGGSAGSPCSGDLFLVKTGANGGRNNLPLDTKNIMPRLGVAY